MKDDVRGRSEVLYFSSHTVEPGLEAAIDIRRNLRDNRQEFPIWLPGLGPSARFDEGPNGLDEGIGLLSEAVVSRLVQDVHLCVRRVREEKTHGIQPDGVQDS